jgi:hypothetical protein
MGAAVTEIVDLVGRHLDDHPRTWSHSQHIAVTLLLSRCLSRDRSRLGHSVGYPKRFRYVERKIGEDENLSRLMKKTKVRRLRQWRGWPTPGGPHT